jgi:hypothetical protein
VMYFALVSRGWLARLYKCKAKLMLAGSAVATSRGPESVLTGPGQHALGSSSKKGSSGDELTTASRKRDKTTASHHQARQSQSRK